jgi:hypothetical protein
MFVNVVHAHPTPPKGYPVVRACHPTPVKVYRFLILKGKPFLGMKGFAMNTNLHGGTAYGRGKEVATHAPASEIPGRLLEAVSHTRSLEASPERAFSTLASLAMGDSAVGDGAVVEHLRLWRFAAGTF